MGMYYKKNDYHGRWACVGDVIMTTLPQEHIFGMDRLDI